jgi:hypothetical protein
MPLKYTNSHKLFRVLCQQNYSGLFRFIIHTDMDLKTVILVFVLALNYKIIAGIYAIQFYHALLYSIQISCAYLTNSSIQI